MKTKQIADLIAAEEAALVALDAAPEWRLGDAPWSEAEAEHSSGLARTYELARDARIAAQNAVLPPYED